MKDGDITASDDEQVKKLAIEVLEKAQKKAPIEAPDDGRHFITFDVHLKKRIGVEVAAPLIYKLIGTFAALAPNLEMSIHADRHQNTSSHIRFSMPKNPPALNRFKDLLPAAMSYIENGSKFSATSINADDQILTSRVGTEINTRDTQAICPLILRGIIESQESGIYETRTEAGHPIAIPGVSISLNAANEDQLIYSVNLMHTVFLNTAGVPITFFKDDNGLFIGFPTLMGEEHYQEPLKEIQQTVAANKHTMSHIIRGALHDIGINQSNMVH